MSAVAALATCLGTWTLTQMVAEYRLAGRVERAVGIDSLLFTALDRIAVERPFVGNALLADDPPGAAFGAALARIRQRADDALATIVGRISQVYYPGADAQMAVVQRARGDLAAWRSKVDATLLLRKADRDPDIFLRCIVSLNDIFDDIGGALDIGDMAAALHDGTAVELVTLSRHVWTVRTVAGVRTVPLIAAIDDGAALDGTALEAEARFQGQLAAHWTFITALSHSLSHETGLVAAIATGRAAFDRLDRRLASVTAAGRAGAAYPVTALELGQELVATAPPLLAIRDEALSGALRRVAGRRLVALFNVIVAASVLGVTVAAMGVVLVVLQRRIVSPVLDLTEVIARIARLDFDVEIPARNRTDEIGRMAAAVETLRQGAIAGEENKARITRMARHDALTGLPNRTVLHERLEQAVAMAGRGQVSAVLCLDLDRFKAVNDTYGHPKGDLLLQAVAGRLSACVRDVDTVSRLGGDEFVVLLAGVDPPGQAALVAKRIVREMNQPFDLDGTVAGVGVSIGIALAPLDATSGVALLKCADTALYRAKAEDKGGWRFFKPEMDARQQDRMTLERDLRDALRTGAFELGYQPQYDLADDRLCGFEALLRWCHPARGNVPPDVFIPIAEETGLIIAIGEWVLRHACAEAAHWPDGVTLAVNLSAVQFKSPDLVRAVTDSLAATGLAPRRLELEMTETALVENNETALGVIRAFHGMGIQIAMDDFGTGYSSLSFLRAFPFDKVKIDKSFVQDMHADAGSRAIVRAMVGLAGSLGLRTVAEGVETGAQLVELRRLGCDYAQGYLFSRPVPAGKARSLLGMGAEVA
jgi:diguanylate cyclase (GGDEF)-like protein